MEVGSLFECGVLKLGFVIENEIFEVDVLVEGGVLEGGSLAEGEVLSSGWVCVAQEVYFLELGASETDEFFKLCFPKCSLALKFGSFEIG